MKIKYYKMYDDILIKKSFVISEVNYFIIEAVDDQDALTLFYETSNSEFLESEIIDIVEQT